VQAAIASGASITVSDTAPASPAANALWLDSVGMQLYSWYNDGNSTQWAPVINQQGALAEAPTDGATYGRRSGTWSNVATAPQVQANVGRNLLHNGLFNVQQRGAGSWTANGYTADRWQLQGDGTMSASVPAMNDTGRSQIGDEAAAYAFGFTFTGASAAGSYTALNQNLEGVRRTAGKTVTVSFWAQASAALKFAVAFIQSFGSGGSPSPAVTVNGQSVTLSTTWTRYSVTIALPSVSGKTFGTNAGSDYLAMYLLYSAGSGNAAWSGNIGVQSGTVNLWGIQLEVGSVATPLEKLDPRMDKANCSRFFQLLYASGRGQASAGGAIWDNTVTWQDMRALPTATLVTAGVSGSATSIALSIIGSNSGRFEFSGTAAGDNYALNYLYSLSADL